MSAQPPTVALVPVRSLASGKRRLASVLDAPTRSALVQAMLADVLTALNGSRTITRVIVVSSDSMVAPIAASTDALLLPDAPEGGLNASLAAALAWVDAAYPRHAALIVPADLPVLTTDILGSCVLRTDAEVVIARSTDGGTNLLLLRAHPGPRLCFGPESCSRHRAAALAQGLTVTVLEHPVLAHDLDTAKDLIEVLPLLPPGQTRDLLGRLRPAELSFSRGAS